MRPIDRPRRRTLGAITGGLLAIGSTNGNIGVPSSATMSFSQAT